MATGQLRGVLHHLFEAALLPDGGTTDGQLLERFLARQDEAAFAALVGRHGPMVLGVCRRVLDNGHDAEDAFQATFLVLLRKATSIRRRESVGSWLYGVAYRAALEAQAAQRRSRERQVSTMPEPEVVVEADVWHDVRPLLDRELSGLPDKYQEAVVLCDLEGKPRKEAARQLGIPEGTLSSRLATARRLLAQRLARHGPALSGGALAAVLSQGAASAGVPRSLVASTVEVATLVAAGEAAAGDVISAKVAAIMKGVLRAMLMTKLTMAKAVLLLVALLGAGVFLAEAPVPMPAVKAEAPAAKGEMIAYIDLQPKANQKLTDNFHSGTEGNNLADLPTGKQTFAGVKFDIRPGMVQLGSERLKDKPEKVEGIKVEQKFDRLHILHATAYSVDDDTSIGAYVVHYADKSKETIEIVYGKDVIDWWFYPSSKEVTRGKKAWEGKNEPAKGFDASLRLYLTTWENPHPGKQVVRIDYTSTLTDAAPFCVAMTVERRK